METEDRTYDTKTWKTGNSLVITIPKTTAKKLKIKSGDNIKVTISK
jgi:antitoxin component of MazEF toxin-antitoxin module